MDDFYVEKEDSFGDKTNTLTIEESENSLVFYLEEYNEECQIELEKSDIVELIAYLQVWLEETKNHENI